MVYSNVFLFDLYDSAENGGKSGERSARKLVAAKRRFYQVLHGRVNTLARNK